MRADPEPAAFVSFQHRPARGPLSAFVGLFWYWSGHSVPFERERLLPMGTVELVIRLDSGRVSDSGISGPRSAPLIIGRQATDRLLGIHFKSGGAYPFLCSPFGELHNRGVTLADLWGELRAGRLLELLNAATTIEGKFQALERWLLWVADRPIRHHPAVCLALAEFEKDPGLSSSAELAQKVNLSQRRFIELFEREVGMTPKRFCRVQRFQNVIRSIAHKTDVDWVDVALLHGYTDQSHFIHDFRAFSGLRPTEYLPLRTAHLSHVRFPEAATSTHLVTSGR